MVSRTHSFAWSGCRPSCSRCRRGVNCMGDSDFEARGRCCKPTYEGRLAMLQTDRLHMRLWTADDFEQFAAMFQEREVMQFLSEDGALLSRFAAWQNFAAQVGHWHLRGFGLFAVVEKSSSEFVGRVGPWFPES